MENNVSKRITIAIPSYNRPKELLRLLESIDSTQNEKIEIVICEDKSPKREEISSVVNSFKDKTINERLYL